MPFNYQTLKNITNASIIDGTLTANDLADSSIDASKIQSTVIGSAELATNAVDVGSSVVTGTLTIAAGGLNLGSFNGGTRALQSNGSSLSWEQHGVSSMQVWTGNGTWTRPAGVKYIKIQVQGGAGGGSGHGEGGGAGGYAERILDVTGISSVGITIGGGGSGTYYSSAGGNGNSTSFGPYVSAGGGHGANRQNQHSGGVSGVGSGGNLNIHSGGGFCHHSYSSQSCANTFFGGGAPGNHPQGGHFAHNHQTHTAPGTGGSGAHFHGHRGSDGRPGLVVVTNYY